MTGDWLAGAGGTLCLTGFGIGYYVGRRRTHRHDGRRLTVTVTTDHHDDVDDNRATPPE